MKCLSCNKELEYNYKQCPYCGHKLKKGTLKQLSEQKQEIINMLKHGDSSEKFKAIAFVAMILTIVFFVLSIAVFFYIVFAIILGIFGGPNIHNIISMIPIDLDTGFICFFISVFFLIISGLSIIISFILKACKK